MAITKSNTLTSTKNSQSISSSITLASYDVFDISKVTITEVVDKGAGVVYFPGDSITFTTTIHNGETSDLTDVTINTKIDATIKAETYKIGAAAAVPASSNTIEITNQTISTASDYTLVVTGVII